MIKSLHILSITLLFTIGACVIPRISSAVEPSPYTHYNEQIHHNYHRASEAYQDPWQRAVAREIEAQKHSRWKEVDQKVLQIKPSVYSKMDQDFKKVKPSEPEKKGFEFSEKYSREKVIGRSLDKHEFKISQQTFYARYVEPDIMKQRGKMFGVGTTYTYRPNRYDPLYSETINTYRLDGMYASGDFQYEAEASSQAGLRVDKDNHMFEIRGLLGKEFADQNNNNQVFLYSGYGYRYLHDDDDGSLIFVPGKGYFYAYERHSNYHYIPAGFEVRHRLDEDSQLTFNMEYNHLIRGKQFSQFSDGDKWICCTTDITNDQHNGYGLRGSLAYEKTLPYVNLSFEPFFRYWNIDDSEISTGYYNGTPLYAIEPENETFEVGAKTSFIF